MPYTLLKFLLWFGLAAVIGGVIGWLLRSLKCRAEVAHAREATVDSDDVDRMRHRLANLEQVVAERDRLRMQVADLRAADSPGVVGAGIPDPEPAESSDPTLEDASHDDDGGTEDSDDSEPSIVPEPDTASEQDDAEPAEIAGLVAVPDLPDDDDDTPTVVDDDDVGTDESGERAVDDPTVENDTDEAVVSDASDTAAESAAPEPSPDLAAGAAVLGKKIQLDDLTVVEGIGPKISELCRGIGVETWRALADTDVAVLRSMLDDAGPRYQIHKPDTWAQQAELLATGQWDAFVALTDELEAGR